LWIGLYDLANSMGLAGQLTHPDILAAIDRVLAACRAHRKAPGVLATGVADAKTQLARGFKLVAYGGDSWIYQTALREALAAIRADL